MNCYCSSSQKQSYTRRVEIRVSLSQEYARDLEHRASPLPNQFSSRIHAIAVKSETNANSRIAWMTSYTDTRFHAYNIHGGSDHGEQEGDTASVY